MSRTSQLGLGILAVSLALGALGDFLLRPAPWGAGTVLWFGALLWAMLALAHWRGVSLTGGGRWLILPVLFFAAALAWRDSTTLRSLDVLALLVSLGIIAWRSRVGRVRIAGMFDYVAAQVVAAGHVLLGVLMLVSDDVEWRAIPRGRWSRRTMAVGRGMLIGLPLVFLFGSLFNAADAEFENFTRNLFKWDMNALLTTTFYVGAWAWLSAGFLRMTLLRPDSEATPGSRLTSYSIGAIELTTVLGLLNVLFLAFVLIQFRYFFGGEGVVLATDGLTYAEYARRGFFELVTVAALVLPMLLAAHWLLPKDDSRAVRLFRPLAASLIGLLFVIMVSAVQRMLLYQREFGLTELRLYTTAFMGWLAIVFVWFLLTVLRSRRDRFAFGALVAGFAVIAALHAINPDDLIVRVNTNRSDAPNPYDALYVFNLSADAVPALVEAMPSMSASDRAYTAQRLLGRWSAPARGDWRNWNFSRMRAEQVVADQQAQLQAWTSQYSK